MRVNNHIDLKRYRDLLKADAAQARESRNSVLASLLSFGKSLNS